MEQSLELREGLSQAQVIRETVPDSGHSEMTLVPTLGEQIGLGHWFGQRYYQNKTKLRYKFGSVYFKSIV